jgi:NodT family efflux transporter outer membrane factor (OMF) lipoprotein
MMKRRISLIAALLMTSACSMAPAYHVPTGAAPTAAFKAAPGWASAAPADDVAKGQWWHLFNDPVLNGLEAKVAITNQNIAAYRAAYAQAQALVRADRAALFPTAGVSAGATRSGAISGAGAATSAFSADASASWAPDLWGKQANTTSQARAQAEASAATLANATLSAQGTLASDYLQLRGIDAQAAMLDDTLTAYRRSLTITQNKFNAGTVSRADVETAQTTLSNAEANRRDLDRQRAALENAIAVLVGENPSSFTLAAAPWQPVVPAVPAVVPGDILQRRPDIANAERLVAAANANIGIQRAAFFPTVSLTGQAGSSASSVASLFSAATSLWSLGASAAETLIDFGARSAKVAQARAGYDGAVATYRQTVLAAFQEVETDLSALTAYRAEAVHYTTANAAAARAETITRNQYAAGTVDYTTVTTAQAAAYGARVNLIQNTVNRQNAAVAVIQAIGGEWTGGVELAPVIKH